MRRFVPLLLTLFCLSVTGHSHNADSLVTLSQSALERADWEEALAQASLLYDMYQQQLVHDMLPDSTQVDKDDYIYALQTLQACHDALGHTEEALRYAQTLLQFTLQDAATYRYEYIWALTDISSLYSTLSDLPQATNYALQALNETFAYVTASMPTWVGSGDYTSIRQAALMTEQVITQTFDAIEDCYTAASEADRMVLKRNIDADALTQQFAYVYGQMAAMYTAEQAPQKKALLELLTEMYRHVLCHSLLFAQRLSDGSDENAGQGYVEQVLRIAPPTDTYYTLATARMAAVYTIQEQYDSTAVWLDRLQALDSDESYQDMIAENRAWIAAVNNDWANALPLLRRQFERKMRHIQRQFYCLSAEARQHIWLSDYLWYFRQNIDLCTSAPHPEEVNAFIYDNILAEKGILLSTEAEVLSLLRARGDEALVDSLLVLRQVQGLSEEEEDRIAAIEHRIAAQCQEMSDYSQVLTLRYTDIQARLREDDIAVEFVQSEAEGEAVMNAVVLRKHWLYPKMIPLGKTEQFAGLQRNRRNLLKIEYTQALWEPIIHAAHIEQGEHIYFSPDGLFYLTGIEYMVVDSLHTMNDLYDMHRMSSTRELCVQQASAVLLRDTAVLYGGVCYAETEDATSTVPYLPATLDEVLAIDSLIPVTRIHTCGDATESSFRALSARSPSALHIATHGFFIQRKRDKQHHPLYAVSTAQPTSTRALLLPRLIPNAHINIEDYALTRAGLLMAGSGEAWGAESFAPDDDGVLTAKEIAALDLRGIGILVLSACKTALGELTVDGVAGLQRGFKKAGIHTMLLSLWQVDDNATKLLMQEFYRCLVSGSTPTMALRQAQQYLRSYSPYDREHYTSSMAGTTNNLQDRIFHRTVRQKQTEGMKKHEGEMRLIADMDDDFYPYANPYYWAAFVLLDAR